MQTGIVQFLSLAKGYGFLRPEDGGGDNFVHILSAHAVGLETLALGDRFTYDIQIARNGKASAVNLVKLA